MFTLGVVGTAGLVGCEIIHSLELLNIIPNVIKFYGSRKGETIFNNQVYPVIPFKNEFIDELDYCILAVDNNVAKSIIEYSMLNNSKCVIIDNSSEYRLESTIPLIIPEINKDVIKLHDKIIANPNCSTTVLAMLLKPLTTICDNSIRKVYVTTFQAASGAGARGLDELIEQTGLISTVGRLTEGSMSFWHRQYVYNVFSHNSKINSETLFNEEEMKMINETKKILMLPIKISPTCVRVPTIRSHALSVSVEFESEVELDNILNSFKMFDPSGLSICVTDDVVNGEFPEPVKSTNDVKVSIGRIRHDIDDKTVWKFFICGDQLLKGAAYNSVQILQHMLSMK
jgi:aspartate-semialdehyde dehydrogenase